jgi:acetoin utilization protein AcuC
MSSSVRVVWDESLTTYDFGPSHPMAPLRVDLAMRLARALGLLDAPVVTVSGAPVADDALLRLVHEQGYIDAVRRASADPRDCDPSRGLGTEDNPVFAGMHEASAHIVGATVTAAEAVWSGGAEHAVNISGGLHHAMPAAASGFCIYNDVAVAIARLLADGAERVAYVDVDVHHGDGVQHVFWNDPRVLTISLHESGRALFPGTGFPEECGGPDADGCAVNVALPPGIGDNGWLRAFHTIVPHLIEAFEPQVLVTQHGCDSHFLDPLAHLTLSLDGQRMAYEALHRLAHAYAGGRWIATGGGGYEIVEVVPRAWAHLIGEAAGVPVDPQTQTPEEWRDHVKRRTGRTAPLRMTDGREPVVKDWTTGYDPGDWLDRSILATRKAVFPAHGLDVMADL